MAWTSVDEVYGRQFSTGIRATSGIRVFLCKSDTIIKDISLATVATDGVTTIPVKGASWPAGGANTTGLKVVSIAPEEIDHERKTYKVVVEYSTENEKDQFVPNPADRDWQVHWGAEWVEEMAYRTATDTTVGGITSSFPTGADFEIKGRTINKPVVNKVKDRIPAVDRRARWMGTFQKYYTSAGFAGIGGVAGIGLYLDSCNDTAITIGGLTAGIYTLLMDDIAVENVTENGYSVISVTYKIIYDPYTHCSILLNAGFNAYTTADDATTKRKVSIKGQAISDAMPLKDDGTLCNDADKRIYYAFGNKVSTTWSTLGLPAAIPT